MEPEFLTWEIVLSLHRRSLELFGGADGIREEVGLRSALAAGENTFFYGNGDQYTVAATYAFHLAESQGTWTGTSAPQQSARSHF